MDFKEFLQKTESFDWAKRIGQALPDLDLGLPKVERSGKIVFLLSKRNPIFLQLEDGTKLFFSPEEFRRIQGEPEVGKTLFVTMQRTNDDRSKQPSQIVSCRAV